MPQRALDPCSRRDLLGVAAATVATVATAALARPYSLAAADLRTPPPMPRDPAEALDRLYEGNRRFVDGKPLAPHRDMARLREVSSGQKPFAAFLGCADSRVPIEIVFDQGFGDLFVTRIAGNVADPAIIGSLEFGAEVLGCQVVYVLGHTACGAVTATAQGAEVPGQISTLYQHLRRATKEAQGDVEAAIRRNVQLQAEILAEASPVLARRMRDGQLRIAGGVYDLASGLVHPVEVAL
jgi:carbonic anhydrase